MKVKCEVLPVFAPFDLTIRIETVEEMNLLFSQLGANAHNYNADKRMKMDSNTSLIRMHLKDRGASEIS